MEARSCGLATRLGGRGSWADFWPKEEEEAEGGWWRKGWDPRGK